MMHIPTLGFGTYRLKAETAETSIREALKQGYNHIDTANLYKNETEVGKAIIESGIDRNKLFLTTKLKVKDVKAGKEEMIKSIINSLTCLQTDYLDLVLIHGPIEGQLETSWKIMEDIVLGFVPELKGKVRFIGISNYDIEHLKPVLKICRVKPYANQFEVSPYLQRDELINYCKENGIIPVAHTSLIKGEKFGDDKLTDLSTKTDISKPLLLLAWAISKGLVVLPRSSKIEHIAENMKCIDIKLDNEVIKSLDSFHDGYCTHPQYKPQLRL